MIYDVVLVVLIEKLSFFNKQFLGRYLKPVTCKCNAPVIRRQFILFLFPGSGALTPHQLKVIQQVCDCFPFFQIDRNQRPAVTNNQNFENCYTNFVPKLVLSGTVYDQKQPSALGCKDKEPAHYFRFVSEDGCQPPAPEVRQEACKSRQILLCYVRLLQNMSQRD